MDKIPTAFRPVLWSLYHRPRCDRAPFSQLGWEFSGFQSTNPQALFSEGYRHLLMGRETALYDGAMFYPIGSPNLLAALPAPADSQAALFHGLSNFNDAGLNSHNP